MKVGRNEPCPCGSGLKYKKCHLLLDGKASADTLWRGLHELGKRLPADLLRFVKNRYGADLVDDA